MEVKPKKKRKPKKDVGKRGYVNGVPPTPPPGVKFDIQTDPRMPHVQAKMQRARADTLEAEVKELRAVVEARKAVSRVEPVEASNPVLTAYRAVVVNVKEWDEGGLEVQARRVLEDKPGDFMSELRRMEDVEAELRRSGEDNTDGVSGKVGEVVDRLVAEFAC